MRILTYILILILIIIGVSFAILNAEPVTIDYYIGQSHLPLSFLLVITFALGALIGLFVGVLLYFKAKSQNFKLKNRIKLIEKEVLNLRTMPLHDNR